MKYLIILALSLAISQNINAKEWTTEHTKWETAYLITHIIDWGQTLEITQNPKYTELNPIIGKYPTRGKVNKYFLTTAIGHYLVSKHLTSNRELWQKTSFFFELGIISRNVQLGIRTNF